MTPQELKLSILGHAFQGKLVASLPEEGVGTDLLPVIQEECKKRISTGQIKKFKTFSAIADADVDFDVPDTWHLIRLGSICQLLDGEKREGESYPYLEARYLRRRTEPTILTEGKYVATGTNVILVDGENSGEVFHLTESGYMGSTFKVLFVPDALLLEYVIYFLQYHKTTLRNNKKGAAIPHLNKDIFFNLIFPLPPLAEQKRIVAKIGELLPLIDRYEQAWSKLEEFNKRFPVDMQKSILQMAIQGKLVPQLPKEGTGEELFQQIQAEKQRLIKAGTIKKEKPLPEIAEDEKPYDIPTNWTWVRFGDLGSYKKGPFGSAITKSMFVPKGNGSVKVYEQKNAIQKDATLGDYYISREYFESKMKGFELFPGDIIVSCAGTIGETYVMPNEFEQGIINQALMRMKIFEPLYIPYFLVFFDFVLKKDAKSSSKGSAIKNIPPFEVLKNYLVPLPPLAEQKRIVAKLDEILPLCERLK